MVDRPELHEAVAGAKSSASDYNENFDMMMDYVEDNMDVMTEALSIYQTVNNVLTTTGTVELEADKCYKITPTGNVTFSLPTITGDDLGQFHQILVQINLTSSYSITVGTSNYFNDEQPVFSVSGLYDLFYEYDNIAGKWVSGSLYKGVAS